MNITLHKYQTIIDKNPARFRGLIAGIQSGKSFYGAFWLGLRAIKYPDKNHLLLFPTYKLGQQSTLPKFFELWPHFTETYRKQDGVIELPEGGKIFIRSSERPYSLEGMTVKSAWLDEAGQMQRLVWVVVQARLAIEKGEAVLTSTPYSSNWFDHEFYRLAEGGNKDYFCVQYSSADSPYFPPEEQERMKKILTEEEYDMRYRGLFRKYAGLVYRDFDRNTHVIPEDKFWEMRKTGNWRLFRSIDWGYNDPFACIWVAVDKDKNFYIYAEHYQAMKPTDYHVEIINRMSEGEKYEFTIGDSANPQMLEDFRRKGFSIVGSMKGNMANAEQSGISLVRDHLRIQANGKPRLFVIDTCVNTIDEFESYRYPEPRDEKNQDQRPLDFNNHCFSGDTLIWTTKGKIKIKNLVGMTGYLYSRDGKIRKYSNVRETRKNAEMIILEFDDGDQLKVTPDHLLLCDDGVWRESSLLTLESRIQSAMYDKNNQQYNSRVSRSKILSFRKLFRKGWEGKECKSSTTPCSMGILQWKNSKGFSRASQRSQQAKQFNRKSSFVKCVRSYSSSLDPSKKRESENKGEGSSKSFGVQVAQIRKGKEISFVAFEEIVGEEKTLLLKLQALWERIRNSISDTFKVLPSELQNESETKEVKRITRGFEKITFNLEVEETHCLVANGVIAHNCMDSVRYLIHKYYAPTVKKEKEWNVPSWARERYGIKNQNRFGSMYKI